MARGITTGVGGDETVTAKRRSDDSDFALINGDGATGIGDFLMAWRGGADVRGDAVGELMGERGVLRERQVEKQDGLAAFKKCGGGFALTCGLQAFGHRGGVDSLQDGVVCEDINFFDGGIGAGKIGEPQFIDEMRVAVGAGEGDGGVLDREQNGSEIFLGWHASRHGKEEWREHEPNAAETAKGIDNSGLA
jgi:hypothetical protein